MLATSLFLSTDRFRSSGKSLPPQTWTEVICRTLVPLQFTIFHLLENGIAATTPINFKENYNGSWFSMAVLSSIASVNANRWTKELGPSYSSQSPRLITTWKKVPEGTNGAITPAGIIMGMLGGALIGLVNYISLMVFVDREVIASSPYQWPVILVGTLSGLIGPILHSLIGATLQFSGVDENGSVVDDPKRAVKAISGVSFFDKNSVILTSSLISALVIPKMTLFLWL